MNSTVLAWVAGFLVLAPAAQAQSALDRYIAERDAAIARFTPEKMKTIEQPQIEAEEKARAALDPLLLTIVGSVAPKGFGKPKSNLGSLFTGDMDFGRLDGIAFEADEGRTGLVVTTLPLLVRWLKAEQSLPSDPDAALRSTDFLTRATQTDAAILKYAEMPLGGPRVFAMLANRTQDNAPTDAREVFVTAVRGDRVYIAYTELPKPIEIAACSSAHRANEKKVEALGDAGAKPGENNEAFSKRLEAARDRADADLLKCFAERAPKDPRFAQALALGKELLDRMPAQ